MNDSHPTLDQLRARVHKDRHREIGNWLARRWARPSAVHGTWLAIRLGLSAHQVTAAALGSALAGALAIGTGDRRGFVSGVLLSFLAFWLDRVDGQVARWRGTASLDGVYLDYWMHAAWNLALGFALGHGLAARAGEPGWSVAGAAIAAGWTLLAQHNDCRYKAVFQRLKRETRVFRVEGGRGGRPAPPAAWPGPSRAGVSWIAAKLCELHVVLIALTGLAGLAVVAPLAWTWAWRGWAFCLAIIAPLLALARMARAVRAGASEREFAAWFQAVDDPNVSLPLAQTPRRERRIHDAHVLEEDPRATRGRVG